MKERLTIYGWTEALGYHLDAYVHLRGDIVYQVGGEIYLANLSTCRFRIGYNILGSNTLHSCEMTEPDAFANAWNLFPPELHGVVKSFCSVMAAGDMPQRLGNSLRTGQARLAATGFIADDPTYDKVVDWLLSKTVLSAPIITVLKNRDRIETR